MLNVFKKKKLHSESQETNKAKKVNPVKAKNSGFLRFRKVNKDVKFNKDVKSKLLETTNKASYSLCNEYTYLKSIVARQKFVVDLQYKLMCVTELKKSFVADFEKIYKAAYFISNSQRTPKWVDFYDLLFIGESRAIIISKYNTSVGPLLDISDIMYSDLKIDSLSSVFFKIEFLINQMIKLYNEGKNRNFHFKDSIRELKHFGLISNKLYDRLLFLSSIRSKVGRSWSINEVKFTVDGNVKERLVNKQVEFKAMLSEIYVDLIEIYMAVQKPYLRKFSLLWSSRKLFISDPLAFYHM